jgi:hypothetical protein
MLYIYIWIYNISPYICIYIYAAHIIYKICIYICIYDTSKDDHRWLVHGLFNSKQWRGWADRQDCGVKCIQKQYDEMAIAAVKLGTPGSTRDWLPRGWVVRLYPAIREVTAAEPSHVILCILKITLILIL